MLRLLRQEKGSIAVMSSILLISMLGFAALTIDVGILCLNKAQLANIADAATLAGAQELPGDPMKAETKATEYAQLTGKQVGDVVSVDIAPNNREITVNVKRAVNLFFAQVFDISTSDVSAHAKVVLENVSGATGVVPFGVVWQNFVYGQSYTLKEGGGSGYNGNFGGLALGGTGANNYENNIKYGYDSQLRIGDWVTTETGNMSGPTSDGVEYRIGQDAGATFESVKSDSSRIVIVPVIDSLPDHGRSDVQIVGFAAFFLEGAGGSGNDNVVTGKFMKLVVTGDGSDTATDYGLYSATLVE